jgi:hypothetical protein
VKTNYCLAEIGIKFRNEVAHHIEPAVGSNEVGTPKCTRLESNDFSPVGCAFEDWVGTLKRSWKATVAIWSKHVFFGLVIGIAMSASMMTAGFMGTVIPIFSKKLGFDPATTAGPFETAFQDVVGFGVLLWVANLLLPWLK